MAGTTKLSNGTTVKTTTTKRKKQTGVVKATASERAKNNAKAKRRRKEMTKKEWIEMRMRQVYYKALSHKATPAEAKKAADAWKENFRRREAGDTLKKSVSDARTARKTERAGISAERTALNASHKKAMDKIKKIKDPVKRKAQRAAEMAAFKEKSLALAKASKAASANHKEVMAKINASKPKRMKDLIKNYSKIRVAPANYKMHKNSPQPEYYGTRKPREVLAWEAATGKKAKQTRGIEAFGGKKALKKSQSAKSNAASSSKANTASSSMAGKEQPAWGGTRKSPELRQWQKDNPDKKPIVTHGKMAGSTGGPTSVRGKSGAADPAPAPAQEPVTPPQRNKKKKKNKSNTKTVTTKSGTTAKMPAQFDNTKPEVTPPQRKAKTPPTPPTPPTSGGQSRSGGAQSRSGGAQSRNKREQIDWEL